MPDDHSKLVPLLPIPNRTVKRLSADDSADSRVKVGHRQALTARNAPNLIQKILLGVLLCAIHPWFSRALSIDPWRVRIKYNRAFFYPVHAHTQSDPGS